MEKLFGIFSFTMILILVSPILGVLVGAFSGWMVGLVFADTILPTLGRFGVNVSHLSMWQLGACLGFVGGFLKTTVHQK